MGDIFQFEWVRSLAEEMQGPVLEIGSKRYGGHPVSFDYRTLFPAGTQYVGIDMEAGDGVDLVLDMTRDPGTVRERLNGMTFGSIICMSVLEHVKDIFSFSGNLSGMLREGGMAVLSVPFAWGVHAYPDDYWRFTPQAVKYLFPQLRFDDHESWMHTISGRRARLDEGVEYNSFIFPPGMSNREFGGFPWLIENTLFDMVGIKATAAPIPVS